MELSVAPLAAAHEDKPRFAKVFQEVADFPWHTRNPTLLGQGGNFISSDGVGDGKPVDLPECPEE